MKKILSLSVLGVCALIGLESCNASVGVHYGYHRGYHCNRWNGHCGYRRGWHRWHRWGFVDDAQGVVAANQGEDSATLLAKDYGIRESSAQRILTVASNPNGRDEVVKQLGLTKEDLAAIANSNMPSKEAIDNVARALNESPSKMEVLLSDLASDVKAEK